MSEFPQLEGRLLIVYDGECGFCNHSIRWFLARGMGRTGFALRLPPTRLLRNCWPAMAHSPLAKTLTAKQ